MRAVVLHALGFGRAPRAVSPGRAVLAASLSFAFACAPPRSARAPFEAPPAPDSAHSPWLTRLDRDHPLVGRIWSVSERRFVSTDELEVALARAPFALLGEKHDNPDHHRLQAALIDALVRRGRRPVVALEMLDVDRQPAVEDAARLHPGDVDAFFQAVHWDESGWPPSSQYAPVLRSALSNGLRVIAANMTSSETRSIVHHGAAALDPAVADRLGLNVALPGPLAESLRAELEDSHCGMLHGAILDGMATAQRARDAEMAARLVETGRADGAVLIAGTGHTRLDRGVPWELARVGNPGAVSVAFAEVAPGQEAPEGYSVAWHAAALPFSYVWFTPRATDEDPCAEMTRPK